MADTLLSVGLDVGTTSTQLIVSQLTVENQAGAFSVPEMEISQRIVRYRSPVHFTPLLEGNLVDGGKIRDLVEQEYENAGISREDVDTGAVIVTGETSRRENAAAVLSALSELAGDFVVATAGPALESMLAARGSGAVDVSRETGKRVFHMDIGGGTANMALIEKGEILCTDCLNVGGRLLKLTQDGVITYISPVLEGLCDFSVGQRVTAAELEPVAQLLTQALEMAAGLRESTPLLSKLRSAELGDAPGCKVENAVISFSGGVADCIDTQHAPFEFGDIGPILGRAIKNSRLCQGEYRLGAETIRATVIGAGCHSAQLSGSTVYLENVDLPMKNRPVVTLTEEEQNLPGPQLTACIRGKLQQEDAAPVLALPGFSAPDYGKIKALGAFLAEVLPKPAVVAVEQDMAKALGQTIAMAQGTDRACLCIDRVRLRPRDFLDVGPPVGPALPVVVKTLILAGKE